MEWMVLLKGYVLIAVLFVLWSIMGKVKKIVLLYLKEDEPPPRKSPAE